MGAGNVPEVPQLFLVMPSEVFASLVEGKLTDMAVDVELRHHR